MYNKYVKCLQSLISTPKRLFFKFSSGLNNQNISRLLLNMKFQFRIRRKSTTNST
jgi:hypothetical protein